MQDVWKTRVIMLIPITVLFVVFVAAFAYDVRDLSADAVRIYKEKEEKAGKKPESTTIGL